jgi:hypothetical protein
MFPEKLVLEHIIYHNPKVITFPYLKDLELKKVKNKEYKVLKFDGINKHMIGLVFIGGEQAYKIVDYKRKRKVEQEGGYTDTYTYAHFTIEEYSDKNTKRILSIFKNIKEWLHVCADGVEERGSIRLADAVRNMSDNIRLWHIQEG